MKEVPLDSVEEIQDKIREAAPYPLLSVETFIELTFDLSGEETPPDRDQLLELGVNFSIDYATKELKIWVRTDEDDQIISVLSEK